MHYLILAFEKSDFSFCHGTHPTRREARLTNQDPRTRDSRTRDYARMTSMMQTLVPREEQIIGMEQATEDAGMKEESFLKDAAEAGEELMARHIEEEACKVHAALYVSPPSGEDEEFMREEQEFEDWVCSRRDSDKDFGFMPFSDSESTEEVQVNLDLDLDLDAESDNTRKRARSESSDAKTAVDVEARADCSQVDLDLDAESDDAPGTPVSRKRARKGSSRAKTAVDAKACATTGPAGRHAPVCKRLTKKVGYYKDVFDDLHAKGIVEIQRNTDDANNSIFGWASMTTTQENIEAFSARIEATFKVHYSTNKDPIGDFFKWLCTHKIGCTKTSASKETGSGDKIQRFKDTLLNVPRVFTFHSERGGR